MKKMAILLTAVLLLGMLFSGCGQTAVSSIPEGGGSSGPGQEAQGPYAGLSLEKEQKVVMYASATEPNAIGEVLKLVNERTKAAINTTIDLYFIPSAERSTKYPLVMAGGDAVDLIYTANWCYYKEQVEKGGFMELTEDFLNKYMPQTMAALPQAAWEETKINGKMYMVPRNTAAIFPDVGPVINVDIAKKYGFDQDAIKTYDDFENFLLTVADNEPGVFAFYASGSNTLYSLALTEKNNLINNQASDYVFYSQLSDPTFQNAFFLYDSEMYKEYALRMARYAAAKVWPSDAITNSNTTSALFRNGQSASCAQNYYNGIVSIDSFRASGINAYLLDIFPEGYRPLRDSYIGDGMAIPAFSKIPERAAVALDFIKNDFETYMLLAGGIEGRHYVYDKETNTVGPGPETGDYEFGGWAWGIRHQDFPWPKTDDPYINAVNEKLQEIQVKDEEWPFWGFTFDYAPVSAEWAVLSALVNEYGTSFSLGQFGSATEQTYEEFVGKLREGGLDKYMEEWTRQRDAFLEK